MLRFTFRQLEYFVAVCDCGSIALASEKIRVSSPSISAAINQLEKEFGLPLFVRQHAKGLAPTMAGRRMLTQARIILRSADQLNNIADDLSDSIAGHLAIGCMLTFAQVLLAPLRASFTAKYPDVKITQFERDQSDIFSQLRRAEIDLALTYDLDLPADLNFRSFATLPPFVMLDETHHLAQKASIAIEELLPHPMVLLDLPHSSDYFLSFFANLGVKPNIVERTRDMAAMRSLVANGFGYAIANLRPLNDLSPDGKPLRFVPLSGDLRPMRVGVLTAHEAAKMNVIRAFYQHCVDAYARGEIAGLNPPPPQNPQKAKIRSLP